MWQQEGTVLFPRCTSIYIDVGVSEQENLKEEKPCAGHSRLVQLHHEKTKTNGRRRQHSIAFLRTDRQLQVLGFRAVLIELEMIDNRLDLRRRRVTVWSLENEEFQVDALTQFRFEHELVGQRARHCRVRMREIVVDASTHLPLVLQGREARRLEVQLGNEVIRSKWLQNKI